MYQLAKKYYKAGLMPIPVNPVNKLRELTDEFGNTTFVGHYKNPRVERWNYQKMSKIFKKAKGLAIVCGVPSGGLEVLDLEGKFSVNGMLLQNLKARVISRLGVEFWDSLVVQETQHRGWHIFYKCPGIVNQKVNNRLGLWRSKVVATNRFGKCLIETRSNPSYAIISPSPGYRLIQGNYASIPTITNQQYFVIHEVCREIHVAEQRLRVMV